jgi:hypothetical protein
LALGSWFGGQSEAVQIAMVAGVVAIILAGVVVFRERLKHWSAGVR